MAGRALKSSVYIVGAKRTPFGTLGGSLKNLTNTQMQVHASKAALTQAGLQGQDIDTCTIGTLLPSSTAFSFIARHTALEVGAPLSTPALTVNRLCGSGFQAIINTAEQIEMGMGKVGLAGGSEQMSNTPHVVFGMRDGVKLGSDIKMLDYLWSGFTDEGAKIAMGQTAENLAEQYGISREDADNMAIRSQTSWKQAKDNGYFDAEIAPIELKKGRKGLVTFDTDEHPRPEVTMDQLAKLPTVFKKGGAVTAANASGICDGAAATILADEATVQAKNLKPIARLVAYSYVGCDPKIMGIGPVPAINKVLEAANLTRNDVGIFDINEAFAPQFLACEKALELDPSRTNMCGGAIALGHPLAASGARITNNLAHALQRTGDQYAVGSACIGGGQGIAVLLERC